MKKKTLSNKSLDLLLINPACIDHTPKNIFSLFFHKLVNYCPPGLLYLASNARESNYKVKIYDMELDDKLSNLVKFIKKESPKVIGLTALTFTYKNALKVLSIIRLKFPKVITIMGGLHVSRFPKDPIEKKLVDYVLVGEAEYTLIQLLDYIIHNNDSLNRIPGLVYSNGNEIIKNEGFPLINDLNKLPFPAIDLLDQKRYFVSFQKHHPSTIIMGSRGCPFNCIFCDKLTNRTRFRSPKNIVSEMKYVYSKFGIKDFQFYDLSFNINRNWVKELCYYLKMEKMPIFWRCTARVELIDEEIMRLMKEAGCYLIAFGVESGNNESLKFLKKGFKLKDIIKAFKLAKKYSIETHAYYIIGIPGEDKKMVLNTIRLLKSIRPEYLNSLTLRPLPFTELADLAKRNGWFDFVNYNILSSDNKYQNNVSLEYAEMSNAEILKMKNLSMCSYFLNLGYIYRMTKKFLKEPKRFLVNIWCSLRELIRIF